MNAQHLFAKHECKIGQNKILVKDHLNGNASTAKGDSLCPLYRIYFYYPCIACLQSWRIYHPVIWTDWVFLSVCIFKEAYILNVCLHQGVQAGRQSSII